MSICFENINDYIIPMDSFELKWRFTEDKYDKLPIKHLEQLKPLNKVASQFLWKYLSKNKLHKDFPFKKDFFRSIEMVEILNDNETEIKHWLSQRSLQFDTMVFLSWDKDDSMIVPWKLLIKYFDSFYYPSSDDLTVFDSSLTCALLFFHTDEIYFGSNNNFIPI